MRDKLYEMVSRECDIKHATYRGLMDRYRIGYNRAMLYLSYLADDAIKDEE